MAAFSGSALVMQWVQAAATTVITGDHKSFTYTPSINLIDATAGADANKNYIPGVRDGTWTFNATLQDGSSAGGTSTFSTLAEGNIGTLIVMPEGTAAGKTKITLPSISQGAAYSIPYDNVIEMTVNGQQNGARVDGTN